MIGVSGGFETDSVDVRHKTGVFPDEILNV